MEVFFIIIGILLILIGLIGCFVPVLPGPPLAYISLLLLQIGPEVPFSLKFMLIMAGVVAAVTILDYLIPALGAKKWGGSKYGIIGVLVGVVMGIFIFPPFGLLIFPLIGAFTGEVLNGADSSQAFKAAFGTFVGLLFGTMLKFSTTIIIAYYFFSNL
ncbi:MAG: DUF456 domain-containing protein [Cyclobacteriaceae bacterium]|nr:DUF456 domain-containing protein [Cyclobacteriaceae bacterium]MCK5371740.1 DUF456 domain-containing protein [Cyclobacteriaceae bacterium]MCK5705269.1 DUF456 domain-containing protein [Cyclobacteriaceae bacterium]